MGSEPAPPGYDLASSSWGPEELAAIQKVVAGGRFTMGEHVKAFEAAFCKRFGVRHAVMVNSGSSANLIGVAALFFKKDRPLEAGDEVIVPAISWATTYHPLQQYGLRLRFVDVDLDTLNLDVRQLEKALTKRTRMVLAVSILGNPARLDVMRKFCDAHGLWFFEDNCESMGAELDGKACGTFGDIGTFSSFFSHHISTMEGGVLVTDDEELAHLAICLRAHGWTRDLPDPSPIFSRRSEDFFEAYRFILPGYNVRPLELSGAIGVEQLKKLDGMIEMRRRNGRLFQQLFAGDPRFVIQQETGKSSWFSFTVVLRPDPAIDRAKVLAALKRAGIGYRIITGGNFLRHDCIRYFKHSVVGKATPSADLAHDRGFFVGNHPRDLERELTQFRQVLDRAAR